MGTMAFQFPNERVGFLGGSAALVFIGITLFLLVPPTPATAPAGAGTD
jgi:hypothetical protein